MTSTRNPLSEFILTPQQQNLLFAALNSNKANNAQPNSALALSPLSFQESPAQGLESVGSFQNSPDLEYEYDFAGADSSFDFSFDHSNQPKMIGDLPGSSSTKSDSAEMESPDKRSHPDDDDDDDNGGGKRRESEDKVAKKPGRKPLTTEPSSKRKAQNRAAQRAFRERKEKHVKDLETKVDELEKASQAANHENGLLRAKVDKMTVELNEYKKRVSLMANKNRPSINHGLSHGAFGLPVINNINDVNFQFEFPKFGTLPGPKEPKKSPVTAPSSKRGSRDQLSPLDKSSSSNSPANSSNYGLESQNKDDLASFAAGLFSPPLTNVNVANASRTSLDSHYSAGGATSTSSPSASSNSNMGGPSSSCGTSPEPFTQSPMGFKPVDTLTTIGEEQSSLNDQAPDFDQFANVDMVDFNWLPQNFQFDPQLFGDYREPQENILTNGLDDSFFNDAFDVDFTTPYNLPATTPAAAPKKDIIAQIDAAKNADKVDSNGQLLTCNKIWYEEKLQNCPTVQNGDFDLDGLCSDLQKKAKCSGSGAVVDEKDFKMVMKKYLSKSDKEFEECGKAISSA
ncbi:transcription factor PAP1-domain-containing protein [Lasiosphaeris hirsuta]|uniref:Transcription factor PAP1-domain-containing protein n=1 Tax=Lasiosphaeris hirsuta TaxID=260670 RepID=A0AA40A1K2_9PEZI|nr:transcription factor PAP1-domain-containing protein [Lasiosphaeris hirsuta]